LLCAPVALLAAKVIRSRAVLHVQDLEVDAAFAVGHLSDHSVLKRFGFFCERILLSGFDRVITISGRMRDHLRRKGVKSEHLSVIRNWVDLRQIRPLDTPNSYREQLQIGKETFVVLYAGNIGAKQALHIVLDAAARVADQPELLFVIAGDGPEKPGLISRGLRNVRFLPLQPEEKLCELLNFADLHVLPQEKGAADLVLPSKLGGMLASGRPMVVTADPDTELYEFLNGTAAIVPAGDDSALAAEILRLRRLPAPPLGIGAGLAGALDSGINLSEICSLICDGDEREIGAQTASWTAPKATSDSNSNAQGQET
jgi:colanic acid biosynthesis glycosyl transferase WcaI